MIISNDRNNRVSDTVTIIQIIAGPPQVQAEGNRLNYQWNPGISEWYANDTQGLEHGYTLHAKPEGNGDLQIRLTVLGNLKPALSNDKAVLFKDAAGHEFLNYSQLKVTDAHGQTLPARFAVQGNRLALVVDDTPAHYPLTIDPLAQVAQQAYVKASNTGAYDAFGMSVAVSGDTLVVGAHGESSNATGINGGNQADNSATQSGAAYVFVRSGMTWSQQAYLKAFYCDGIHSPTRRFPSRSRRSNHCGHCKGP